MTTSPIRWTIKSSNTITFLVLVGRLVLFIVFQALIAWIVNSLAIYFIYVMQKLKKQLKVKWLAVLLPVIFLAIQHCTLPFIPDLNFIVYRALVFLPFAVLIGLSIYYRPSLFIYFAILHGLMDFGTAVMFLLEINSTTTF